MPKKIKGVVAKKILFKEIKNPPAPFKSLERRNINKDEKKIIINNIEILMSESIKIKDKEAWVLKG